MTMEWIEKYPTLAAWMKDVKLSDTPPEALREMALKLWKVDKPPSSDREPE